MHDLFSLDQTPPAATTASETVPRPKRTRVLPDVANDDVADVPGELDLVGMSEIEVLLQVASGDGIVTRTPARADAFVSLRDPDVKGIHMSRLFLLMQAGFDDTPFGPRSVEDMLRKFVGSHESMSDAGRLRVRYDHVLRRKALLSDHSGWRHYPVRIESSLVRGQLRQRLSVDVTYSSTCPCSAALSRQLLQEGFDQDFAGRKTVSAEELRSWLGSEQAIRALPHAQRSHAEITIELKDTPESFPIELLVDAGESAVDTPVQTVVKRADEQEFARLNGSNLMFCEDAARRIRSVVDGLDFVADYRIAVRHLESLHPHDAVAVVTKGVDGGLEA